MAQAMAATLSIHSFIRISCLGILVLHKWVNLPTPNHTRSTRIYATNCLNILVVMRSLFVGLSANLITTIAIDVPSRRATYCKR